MWAQLAMRSPVNGADIPMLPILESVLLARGSSLGAEFLEFSKRVYSRNWTTHTNEIGLIHPAVPLATYDSYPVNASSRSAPATTLFPYSFAYYTFLPSTSAPQILTLTVSMPGNVAAVAFRKTTGGSITEYPLTATTGTIVVPGFTGTDTSEVALLFSNTSPVDAMIQFSTDGSVPFPVQPVVSGSSSHCFIATATYGSPLHPKVEVLRQFRDRYLLTNLPGRALVALYYRCSPPLAALIARQPALQSVSRLALAPVVWGVEHPLLILLLAGSGLLVTGGSLAWLVVRGSSEG
jgi:hypothetical protein